MNLYVSDCQYPDNGAKRVYNLSDGSILVEHPGLPGKLRMEYYDARGRRVYSGKERQPMKQAVERHKTKWKLAK